MVVDASAILAIFLQEPEAPRFIALIGAASSRLISAATVLEAGIVLDQRPGLAPNATPDTLSAFLINTGFSVIPFTEEHAILARLAYRRFGRGIHAAKLNFGDCISYALAKASDEPLLFKGDDFALTDIRVAS
jgi:ribonuclease VapC